MENLSERLDNLRKEIQKPEFLEGKGRSNQGRRLWPTDHNYRRRHQKLQAYRRFPQSLGLKKYQPPTMTMARNMAVVIFVGSASLRLLIRRWP